MKRMIVVMVLLTCLQMLTGCSFNSSISNNTGITEMDAKYQVATMMEYLTAGDMDQALMLMHPDRTADAWERDKVIYRLKQMIDYIDGRKCTAMQQQSLNVQNSVGTSGSTKQESAIFLVTLGDSTTFRLSVVYLTGNEQEGFLLYQIILGVF